MFHYFLKNDVGFFFRFRHAAYNIDKFYDTM